MKTGQRKIEPPIGKRACPLCTVLEPNFECLVTGCPRELALVESEQQWRILVLAALAAPPRNTKL